MPPLCHKRKVRTSFLSPPHFSGCAVKVQSTNLKSYSNEGKERKCIQEDSPKEEKEGLRGVMCQYVVKALGGGESYLQISVYL